MARIVLFLFLGSISLPDLGNLCGIYKDGDPIGVVDVVCDLY